MKYVYFVNGEERKPTTEEVEHMTVVAMAAAGYIPVDNDCDNINEKSRAKKKS